MARRRVEHGRFHAGRIAGFASFSGPQAMDQLLQHGVDVVCVASPDDRHFEAARLALEALEAGPPNA